MFDLPDAKRIRRADLTRSSSSRSPSPDADTTAAYRAQLARIYGAPAEPSFISPLRDSSPEKPAGDLVEEQEEEEEEFRLFSGGGARKIVIREEDDGGEGGFLGRDPRVWVIGPAKGERRKGIEGCAVEGEEVRRGVGRRAWGLEVPWRVVVVKTGRKKNKDGDGDKGVEEDVVEGKRKRPGKKRRIERRVRIKKVEEEKERKIREGKEKEEAEREKRTRKNRGKKVKRRMKEKAEKAMKKAVEGGGGSPGVDDVPEGGGGS